MSANDFDVMNRFSSMCVEVLDEIVAPIIKSRKEIEIDHYRDFLGDLLSKKKNKRELQLELIAEIREKTPFGRVLGNGAAATGQVFGTEAVQVPEPSMIEVPSIQDLW